MVFYLLLGLITSMSYCFLLNVENKTVQMIGSIFCRFFALIACLFNPSMTSIVFASLVCLSDYAINKNPELGVFLYFLTYSIFNVFAIIASDSIDYHYGIYSLMIVTIPIIAMLVVWKTNWLLKMFVALYGYVVVGLLIFNSINCTGILKLTSILLLLGDVTLAISFMIKNILNIKTNAIMYISQTLFYFGSVFAVMLMC